MLFFIINGYYLKIKLSLTFSEVPARGLFKTSENDNRNYLRSGSNEKMTGQTSEWATR